MAAHLETSIQGAPASFNDETLAEISDVPKIKKQYKLGALPTQDGQANGSQINGADNGIRRRLELSLVGAIALRGS